MEHLDSRLHHLYIVILTILLIPLAGCSTYAVSTTASPSAIPPTYTPTPSPEPPINTPLPTQTPVPPTPTLAPTLTADKEQKLVLDLLQNNAGCQLPCWWGFTPGKTSWQAAQAFFASLGKKPAGYGNPYITYDIELNILNHHVRLDQMYSVLSDTIDMIWVGTGTIRNNKAIFGDPLFAQDWRRYMIPQLLAAEGQPKEVLIRTFRGAPGGGWVPFHLLLFYPQQGILVDYQGPNESKGDHLQWCPQKTNIALWLWPPEHQWALEDVARTNFGGFTIEEVLNYRSLQEATGMSVEKFYDTFKNSSSGTCLETPANMWP